MSDVFTRFDVKIRSAEKKIAGEIDGEYARLRKEGLNPLEAAYVVSEALGFVCMPPPDDMREFLSTYVPGKKREES